jgi:mono/diheme cytochrome c family protein
VKHAITLCAVFALTAAGAPRQATDGAARIARGKYLANGIARCFGCHSPLSNADPALPIPATLGSGDQWLDGTMQVGAPNLTPDPMTGLGRWTDQQVVRAIREGIGLSGQRLSTHPANHYSVMTDEDGAAIVAYLRSLRPIRRMLPRSAPARRQHESVQPMTTPAQPGALRTAMDRGRYLVQLGECVGCHTPTKADGSPVRALTFGGGRRFFVEKGIGNEVSSFDPTFTSPAASAAPARAGVVASRNLTQDPSGIPYYTEAIFIQTIRTGKVAGVRSLSAAMPWVFFRTMTDADLTDIFAYLRSVKPVQHRVNNSDPPTWCPLCGRRHGLGEFNSISR